MCFIKKKINPPGADKVSEKFASPWVVMARRKSDLGALVADSRWISISGWRDARLWTDDFSSIWGIVRWK